MTITRRTLTQAAAVSALSWPMAQALAQRRKNSVVLGKPAKQCTKIKPPMLLDKPIQPST